VHDSGLLDRETWAAAAVTADVQVIVDGLAARSPTDARSPAGKGGGGGGATSPPQQKANGYGGGGGGADAGNGRAGDRLRIGSEAFCMVSRYIPA